MPVLLRYQTDYIKKSNVKFHALLGPVYGILLSADQYYVADINADGNVVLLDSEIHPADEVTVFQLTEAVEPAKDYFTKSDIGVLLDAGIDIYINDKIYLTPALRVYYGFSDVDAEPTRESGDYKASHNAFVGLHVGINFMNSKK